jgi:hypothetical protein
LFLHKICLLAEFIGCLRKIIFLSYELFFLLTFGRMIGLCIRNSKQLSLHQINFFNSRYSSRNARSSKWAECKTCFWRLRFPSFFFFFCHICIERYRY